MPLVLEHQVHLKEPTQCPTRVFPKELRVIVSGNKLLEAGSFSLGHVLIYLGV